MAVRIGTMISKWGRAQRTIDSHTERSQQMAKRGLAGVTIRQLKQEIARRQRRLTTLQRRRRSVAAQLGELDDEIAALGPARGPGRPAGAKKKRRAVKKKKVGRPKGKKKVVRTVKKKVRRSAKKKTARGGARGRNKLSLGDTLAKVLNAKRPTRVIDAVKAVLKAGYKTKAKGKNFATIVNQALTSDGRFKKVSRGQYVLAG